MRMYDLCGVASLLLFFAVFLWRVVRGEGFAFRSVGWAEMETEMETVERRGEV